MKKVFSFLLLTILSIQLWGCDIACLLCLEFSEKDFVFGGVIVQKGEEFVQIKILDVFRGKEQRDIITIWSGTDWECNGPWSMSADDFGAIGDTILLTTELIEEPINSWDVTCDYRRNYWCFYTSRHNSIPNWIHVHWDEDPMDYKTFKEKWWAQSLAGCDNYESETIACGNSTTLQVTVFPNPSRGQVKVRLSSILENQYVAKVFDAGGKAILEFEITQEEEALDLSHYASGVYFIAIFEAETLVKTTKLLLL